MEPGRESPAVAAPRAPAAVAAAVPAESRVSAGGADPQPGLPKTFPGRGQVAEKVPPPLAAPQGLWAAQGSVLVVDGILDGQRVFVRQKGDAGLGLGELVEHPAVGDALPMGRDRSGGEIGDQSLAIAFIQTSRAAAATAGATSRNERWRGEE